MQARIACECDELGVDGIDDLALKFSTSELAQAFELASLSRGASAMLTLSGSLLDGAEFEASDCMVIRGDHLRAKQGGGR